MLVPALPADILRASKSVIPPPDVPDFEIQRHPPLLEIPLELPVDEEPLPPPPPAKPERPSEPFLRR
jgi:hypothetical protein